MVRAYFFCWCWCDVDFSFYESLCVDFGILRTSFDASTLPGQAYFHGYFQSVSIINERYQIYNIHWYYDQSTICFPKHFFIKTFAHFL